MRRAILIALAGALIAGCETVNPRLEQAAEVRLDANRTAVRAATRAICKDAAVGVLIEEFGDRPEDWHAFCQTSRSFSLTGEDVTFR